MANRLSGRLLGLRRRVWLPLALLVAAVALTLRWTASPVAEEAPPAPPAARVAPDTTARPGLLSGLGDLLPGRGAAPPDSAPEPMRVSYQREFYYYDGAERRDPFKPLLDIDLTIGGPRFDELVLTGIFIGENGDGMVVVEDADRKGYFLTLGDIVGKATLVEIHADFAVFDVRDFGISRRETLKLQRPEETP